MSRVAGQRIDERTAGLATRMAQPHPQPRPLSCCLVRPMRFERLFPALRLPNLQPVRDTRRCAGRGTPHSGTARTGCFNCPWAWIVLGTAHGGAEWHRHPMRMRRDVPSRSGCARFSSTSVTVVRGVAARVRGAQVGVSSWTHALVLCCALLIPLPDLSPSCAAQRSDESKVGRTSSRSAAQRRQRLVRGAPAAAAAASRRRGWRREAETVWMRVEWRDGQQWRRPSSTHASI